MEWAQAALVALIGLLWGSFITLASYRLPRGQDVVFTPSRCPECLHRLGMRDLVPVLSWALCRCRCRFCGGKVHWRYPLIELISGAVFVLLYMQFGLTWEALVLALFAVALLIMIVADFEHYIIPDEVHWALLPLGLAWRVMTETPAGEIAAGAALGLGIGLSLRFGYQLLRGREGLGWGDVKFLCVAGLWLGATALVPFLFFSGIIGVLTALLWRALGKGALFPFGPALALALFLCVVYPHVPEAFWNAQRMLYP